MFDRIIVRVNLYDSTDRGSSQLASHSIITFVNHYTHFVYLYPVKTHSAREMCNAMMSYVAQCSLIDEIKSDPPGSDLMSQEAVANLNKWLGLRHVVSSLTDVHIHV